MAEKMILRKLLTALVFERGGKRIDLAPGVVAEFTPEEAKRIQAMNPDLLEYPSDDEVELFNLRQAKKAPAVDLGAGDLNEGPAAAPTKPAAPAKPKKGGNKPAADAPAAAPEGPATDAGTGTENGTGTDENNDDEI
ncbi:hypothetical protein phiA034_gene0005 [Aeromonas phage phiA034]|uniref:DUF7443 domain-containing protein n=1 Tax=Aeromonas phage phiA034 TaxID=2985287 RepID=A0AAE9YN99_9CAUD|nr:hypothetical protein phiA034_gene0005 [Aeromonas phage phiA034]